MSTIPTLRDAAQALSKLRARYEGHTGHKHPGNDQWRLAFVEAYRDLDAALDALTQGAGEAVEPDSREVVSDDELEQAFRNTNFGGSDHRTLLHVGVLKKACGYHCGHTITTIMTELGLIGIGGVPTKKGRRMMQIAYHSQMLKGP